MTDENVVLFPHSEITEPANMEAIRERLDCIREVFAESAAEAVTMCAIDSMRSAGYPVDYLDHVLDIALMQASIKSLMMKSRGLTHPLQETAEEMFYVDLSEYDAEEASE